MVIGKLKGISSGCHFVGNQLTPKAKMESLDKLPSHLHSKRINAQSLEQSFIGKFSMNFARDMRAWRAFQAPMYGWAHLESEEKDQAL